MRYGYIPLFPDLWYTDSGVGDVVNNNINRLVHRSANSWEKEEKWLVITDNIHGQWWKWQAGTILFGATYASLEKMALHFVCVCVYVFVSVIVFSVCFRGHLKLFGKSWWGSLDCHYFTSPLIIAIKKLMSTMFPPLCFCVKLHHH